MSLCEGDALRFFYQQTPRPGASDTDDLPRVNAPKKLTITLNAEGSHPAHRNGLIDQYGYSAEGNSSMYRFSAE